MSIGPVSDGGKPAGEFDHDRAAAAVRELLIAIGEDPEREGLRDTPARVARAYEELTSGLRKTAKDVLTTTFDLGHDEMVLVRDIELWSMCEHHLVPFTGVAHVGYIPAESGKITGLSKLARLVDVFAKRPQVQERLTTQVADAMVELLDARGVIVVIEAEHLCMTMRGVRKAGARTITSAVRGIMHNAATRSEAMALINASRYVLTQRHLAGFPVVQRPLVMGVVNVTPDSFSDGGRYDEVDRAVEHGLALLEQGADLVDIGGESTRPGATRPLVTEELSRVVPVITGLAAHGAVVSVDTMRAEVAEAAVAAGATLVNDVSGGLADPEILQVAAQHQVGYLAMHWRAHAGEMQQRADLLRRRRRGLRRAAGPGRGSARRGHRAGPAGDRSRPRVREDRRAQLGAAPAPGRFRGVRAAGPARLQPQVLPRSAARRRRGPAAPGLRARGRRGGAEHPGRAGRGLGGAGAPGARHRGRAQGGRTVAGSAISDRPRPRVRSSSD